MLRDGEAVVVMARFAGVVGATNSDVVQGYFSAHRRAGTLYPHGFAKLDCAPYPTSCSLADGTEGIAWCAGTLDSPAAQALRVAWALR